jgi:hypothetical protein
VLAAYVDEQVERRVGGLDGYGPAYEKMYEHMYKPPTYTTADGRRIVSVVPGMDHSKWVALDKLVFVAIAAPIHSANEMKEVENENKRAAAKARKEERQEKDLPVLGDIVGSYSGLCAGGSLPEQVLHVEQVAAKHAEGVTQRRQARQQSAESKTQAELVEARRRIVSKDVKDKPAMPHMKAVVLAYRQNKGASDEALAALKKKMDCAATTKVEFDVALVDVGTAGFPWSDMGVELPSVSVVAADGALVAPQLAATAVAGEPTAAAPESRVAEIEIGAGDSECSDYVDEEEGGMSDEDFEGGVGSTGEGVLETHKQWVEQTKRKAAEQFDYDGNGDEECDGEDSDENAEGSEECESDQEEQENSSGNKRPSPEANQYERQYSNGSSRRQRRR